MQNRTFLIEKLWFFQYSTEMRKGIIQNSSSEDHDSALSIPDKEKLLSNQRLKCNLKQKPHIQFYLKL